MQVQLLYKIAIGLVFFLLSLQSFAQKEQGEIISGKLTVYGTNAPLPFANVLIKISEEEILATTSDAQGNYELSAPVGTHTLEATMVGFSSFSKTIEVRKEKPIIQNITLSMFNEGPPWQSSKPYPELQGLWKPITFQIGDQTIYHSTRTDGAVLSFSFDDPQTPGKISWHDGCNRQGSLFFRHLGAGNIEIEQDRLMETTLRACNKTTVDFRFLQNQTKTTISEKGTILVIGEGNKKYTFQKIHDNLPQELSNELFGTWQPIAGELEGKKITKFANEAAISFGKHTNVRQLTFGLIQYVDGSKCSNAGLSLQYRYMDADFLNFRSFESHIKPTCCRTSLAIEQLFRQFSSSGCTIKFNDAGNTVTLEQEGNMLRMRRN